MPERLRCVISGGSLRGAALWVLLCHTVAAGEVMVAVATNFAPVMEHLEAEFESVSGHRLTAVLGSSGKLATQIRHGAPFDVLLSADRVRPERLEADGFGVSGSRFVYARGSLVLWRPGAGFSDGDGEAYLRGKAYGALAIANPDLAPYGFAARQVLERLGLWASVQDRVARAENIGQAFAMVASGAAPAGLLAEALVVSQPGGIWRVPAALHDPIDQEALLTRLGAGNSAAVEFLRFLRSDAAIGIIRAGGYQTVPDQVPTLFDDSD